MMMMNVTFVTSYRITICQWGFKHFLHISYDTYSTVQQKEINATLFATHCNILREKLVLFVDEDFKLVV